MGDVVNSAAKLARFGNREYYDNETMVSTTFYNNLNDVNKKLMSYNNFRNCYHGNIINSIMNEWNTQNCK